MKRRSILVLAAIILVASIAVPLYINSVKKAHTLPINVDDVSQIGFFISPDTDGNYTITDRSSVAAIVDALNQLDLTTESNQYDSNSLYSMAVYYPDGSFTQIAISGEDKIAIGREGTREKIYETDCRELILACQEAYHAKFPS